MLADRIPHHSALGRILRWPLRFIPRDAPRRILSGPAAGLLWHPAGGPHAIWLGFYERRVLRTFDRELRKCIRRMRQSDVDAACTVWDIGAHAGLFSLIAARAGADVVAFEPLAANVAAIERNLNCNALAHRVRVNAFALGALNGTQAFEADSSGMEGRIADSGTSSVDVCVADELDLPLPAVIKIDVEGAELDVLAGARQTIEAAQPLLFLETHLPIRIEQCLGLLPGYYAHRIDGPRYLCAPGNTPR